MSTHYSIFIRFSQVLGLLIVLLLQFSTALPAYVATGLALLLILTIGIPHGATDHIIFRQLRQAKSLKRFYILYLGSIGLYALLWWISPVVAFSLFLLISAYHFGQSNFYYLKIRPPFKGMLHLLWGAYVILCPVLWQAEESWPIIEALLGLELSNVPTITTRFIVLSLLGLQTGLLIFLFFIKKIVQKELREELLNLLILTLIFTNTPLLLGFSLYFAGWHALGSIIDQIRFFRQQRKNYDWSNYIRQALPYSLTALLGLAGLYAIGSGLKLTFNPALLFIFISVITLPHMVLMDEMYHQ